MNNHKGEGKYDCGIWKFRPHCLQRFCTMNLFVFCLSVYCLAYGTMSVFPGALVTTYERRFDLTTSTLGLFGSVGEIGFIISVLFVSYFGNRINRVRVLAVAAVGISLLGITGSLPYLIFGPKYSHERLVSRATATTDVFSSTLSDSICVRDLLLNATTRRELYKWLAAYQMATKLSANDMAANFEMQSKVITGMFLTMSLAGGFLASPFWSLVPPFIEDNVPLDKSGSYIGFIMGFRFLAPVFGYLFMYWALNQPEDLNPNGLSQHDPMWIGCWWIGYVIFGLITLTVATPLLLFPKKFPKSKKEEEDHEMLPQIKSEPDVKQKIHFKDMLSALRRLLSDSVYMLLNLCTIIGFIGYTVAMTFGSKFVEVYYNLTAANSSLIIGISMAGAICIGCFVGGVITSRLKLSLNGNFGFVVIVTFITSIISLLIYLLQCPTEIVDGVQVDSRSHAQGQYCLKMCHCENTTFYPVCGADNVVYSSPCFAGCTGRDGSSFTGCGCVGAAMANSSHVSDTATAGMCNGMCPNIYFYTILLFVAGVLNGSTFSASYLIVLRLPKHKEDAGLALGIGNFVFSILAIATAPVGGKLIEYACLKTDPTGAYCQIYDKQHFNFLINGLPLYFKIPSFIILLIAWYLLRRRLAKEVQMSRSTNSQQNGQTSDASPQVT